MNKETMFKNYAMLYEKSMERTALEELLSKFSTMILGGDRAKTVLWITHRSYKIRSDILSLLIEQTALPGNLTQEQSEQLLELLANMKIVEHMLAEIFYIGDDQISSMTEAMSGFYLDSPMFSEVSEDNKDSES